MKERLNELTEQIIGAAIQVHKTLGPGLLESAYETCLELELIERGLLMNFNVKWLADEGIKRFVNGFPD